MGRLGFRRTCRAGTGCWRLPPIRIAHPHVRGRGDGQRAAGAGTGRIARVKEREVRAGFSRRGGPVLASRKQCRQGARHACAEGPRWHAGVHSLVPATR